MADSAPFRCPFCHCGFWWFVENWTCPVCFRAMGTSAQERAWRYGQEFPVLSDLSQAVPSAYDRQAWGLKFVKPKKRAASKSSKQRARRRRAVFERDGYKCVACLSTEHLTLDHIIPLSKGGTDALENLQTMCWPCNQAKGDTLPDHEAPVALAVCA